MRRAQHVAGPRIVTIGPAGAEQVIRAVVEAAIAVGRAGRAALGGMDFLDAQELFTAVAAVAQTANAIDDEIKATFGGRLASEV